MCLNIDEKIKLIDVFCYNSMNNAFYRTFLWILSSISLQLEIPIFIYNIISKKLDRKVE